MRKCKKIAVLLMAACMTFAACGTETADDTVSGNDVQVNTEQQENVEEKKTEPVLLFEDYFDGETLDSTKWALCPEWGRQDGICQWRNDMVSLDGEGHLVLNAEWDVEAEKMYSGAVRTDDLFEQTYGYYEASIKFPAVNGIWGAFWMMCGEVSAVDGTSVDGVEVDIIESAYGNKGEYNHAMHWDGYGDDHQKTAKTMRDNAIYDGEYHTFGFWWTEEEYIFYVDGVETWRTTAAGICNKPGYMKLTVEGASWAGLTRFNAKKNLPAQMLVDYVKVWDTNPYVEETVTE